MLCSSYAIVHGAGYYEDSDILVPAIVSQSKTAVSHCASSLKVHRISIQNHCMNLWWGFHVFIQIRGKVSAQSLPPEVFKEHITDIFSMAENERCIMQSPLTDIVGSNLVKYFKSFFFFVWNRICACQNCCWKIETALLAFHLWLDESFSIALLDVIETSVAMI